mmetsp:Transcript_2218/g.5166  ORF Transcript_2218/g.5166 Transcript_2218/m.5166 type:complete len:131 (+) Transcript_2218:243-635(+)
MGGHDLFPTYHNKSNCSETVRLEYDSKKTSYFQILDAYWKYCGDPTLPMPDTGYQLRIFYVDDHQRSAAEASVAEKEKELGKKVYVAVLPASEYVFWKAEEYHQQYFQKQGSRCGAPPPARRLSRQIHIA